jgi:hypothetical protein
MLYVCFTYEKDLRLLALTSARVRQLDPDAVFVAVPDRAAFSSMSVPEGVIQHVSNFDRGGNLNGLACIDGMLRTMAELMDLYQAEHCIKIDADCWCNNLMPWVKSATDNAFDYLATERWHFGQPAGYIYRLSRRLVGRLLDDIAARRSAGLFPPSNKFPEDQTIYALAMQNRAQCALVPFVSGRSTGLCEVEPEHLYRALAADVVHLGEPMADGSRADRLTVYARAIILRDFIASNPPPRFEN